MRAASSDGVTERRRADDRVFGEDGLREVVGRCAGKPAAEIVQTVQNATVNASAKPTRDDATLMIAAADP